MEETLLLTRYISVWNWHLSAVMFLCVASIAAMLGNIVFIIAFSVGVGIAEYMAQKRRIEIHEERH